MTIPASEPDWSREAPRRWWGSSRPLLRAIRRYRAARGPLAPARTRHNCPLFKQVTLGAATGNPGKPWIRGHVEIGAGAKILGNASIGDHARIGPNAVVLCDVPVGAAAVGGTARIVDRLSEIA